jgi:hypothetical protein
MDGLQQNICRARRAREEALEKPQKDFAAWSNDVASKRWLSVYKAVAAMPN